MFPWIFTFNRLLKFSNKEKTKYLDEPLSNLGNVYSITYKQSLMLKISHIKMF